MTASDGAPVQGVTVDVAQTLHNAGPEGRARMGFCNPSGGPNPTGQGGTAIRDLSGSITQSLRAEVGPTNSNGQVSFGITLTPVTYGDVTIVAWVDLADDDDVHEQGEPRDDSTHQWVRGEYFGPISLDAEREQVGSANGHGHQVTVTLRNQFGPMSGVVPSSVILPDASGRPAGDVADPQAGPSPNYAAYQGNTNAYSCTPSDEQGVSVCTFRDLDTTPDGTDTIVFYVNRPDGFTDYFEPDELQDAVQTSWLTAPPPIFNAGPETDTNPVNTAHTITVTSGGGSTIRGDILPGSPNDNQASSLAEITCPRDPTRSFTYTCTYTGAATGTDTIKVFADHNNNSLYDQTEHVDDVTKTWVVPGTPTPGPSPSPSPGPTPTPSATPNPSPSPSPSPTPTTPGPRARNIRLCHGTTAVPGCSSVENYTPGEQRTLAALVTDQDGRPLANVPVELRETGPARLLPSNTNSAIAVTGADGIARFVVTSDVGGTSNFVAEIGPAGSTGGGRGPGAADDECEQPAGPGGAPSAGNCSSGLVAYWLFDGQAGECEDDVDNDGDGRVDAADPSCGDGTEEPFDDVDTPRHGASINMHFEDNPAPADRILAIVGRMSPDDGFEGCIQGRPVNVQRRVDGEWVPKKATTTNRKGRYAVVVFDAPGRYRAVAPRAEVMDDDGVVHVCLKATISKRHRHRR